MNIMPEEVSVLDKGCYWLIVIPVRPDEHGWRFKGLIWIKGRDNPLTHYFVRNVADLEARASEFMRCENDYEQPN